MVSGYESLEALEPLETLFGFKSVETISAEQLCVTATASTAMGAGGGLE